MSLQKLNDPLLVTQMFPEKRQVPLEGLYLDQRLARISEKIGRPLVITNFLSDRNGVIAKADAQNHFEVPLELKNASDWQLFQELMAQADIVISGAAYLKRVSIPGNKAEDILWQFEPGGGFEKLGEWRLAHGHQKRSPDLAIVTHDLDLELPQDLVRRGGKILVFSTNSEASSAKARDLSASGAFVIGCGKTAVDGDQMIDSLSNGMGYLVIMMATGPSVLKILLDANRLDIFYNTEVQLEIPFTDPASVKKILPDGKRVNQPKEFGVIHRYLQENVLSENGSSISQQFIRYDRKGLLNGTPDPDGERRMLWK